MFCGVIDGNVGLQYNIECELAGVVDNSKTTMCTKEKLRRLIQYQNSWKTGKWRYQGDLPNSKDIPAGPLDLSGPYYSFSRGSTIHLYRIPSLIRCIPRLYLPFDIPSFELQDYVHDYTQDILVAMEMSVEE